MNNIPNEEERIGVLQTIRTYIIMSGLPATQENLVAFVEDTPLVHKVVGKERKFLDSLRYLVSEGFIAVHLQPTGEAGGRPQQEYHLSEKGLLELAGEDMTPKDLPLPHTSTQERNPTCVFHACSKALLAGFPEGFDDINFQTVFT